VDAFDPWLKLQNAEWHAVILSSKKIAQCIQGALEVMHVLFFSQNGLVLYHSMPIGIMVSGQYCCALLQDKVRQHILPAVQISPHLITGFLYV
jgi:hypothetical protein